MANESDCDDDVDVIYEDMLSGPLDLRTSMTVIEHLLRKNRVDRLEKLLLEQPLAFHEYLLTPVLEAAARRGWASALQIAFRHKEVVAMVVSGDPLIEEIFFQAFIFQQQECLEILKTFVRFELAANLSAKAELMVGQCAPCCGLFSASLRGDLAEVEAILAGGLLRDCESCTIANQNRKHLCYYEDEEKFMREVSVCDAATVAASRGHVSVACRLLAYMRSNESVYHAVDQRTARSRVLSVAAEKKDLAMAKAIGINTVDDMSVFFKLDASANDLKSILAAMRRNTAEMIETEGTGNDVTRDRLYLIDFFTRQSFFVKHWLVLAVAAHQQHHVIALLDVLVKESSSWRSDEEAEFTRWLVDECGRARSTLILREVLVGWPAFYAMPKIYDPVQMMREHKWPGGARLLVEAGCHVSPTVQHEHQDLFSLSLEDRCRIVARRSLKHPLSESLEKLPLHSRVKLRFLYRYK